MSAGKEIPIELEFMNDLVQNGYEEVKIKNEEELYSNLKKQIERLNNIQLTNDEFDKIKNHLNKGKVFDKAKRLRQKYPLKRDGEVTQHIDFINQKDLCKNIFQVAHQIPIKGMQTRDRRYDVTILINGLPLVQIELKRNRKKIKAAFDQIVKYKKVSYRDLFEYIQIFVISNGEVTKYFANGTTESLDYDFTFYWKDENNNNIKPLKEFTQEFLNKYNLSKMITKYIVTKENNRKLLVLRAYQKYAVEKIVKNATEYKQTGYIWHSTGSGKTLTSFEVSKLLAKEESIYKVIFVVDRKDLNRQTYKEFDRFSPGSVDETKSTRKLLRQMISTSEENDIIVTTINKLNSLCSNFSEHPKLMNIKDNNIIFIYDECHRSQFGIMHQNIKAFFPNSLVYGFTGTPIFPTNAHGGKTTESIFGKCLHKYKIKNAIDDNNVLPFLIEHIETIPEKYKKMENFDESDYWDDEKRIRIVVDHIKETYNKKTYGEYTAMFTVASGIIIHKYYDLLRKEMPNLKIACIFSPNEDTSVDEKTTSEYLEEYMEDYNKDHNTNYSLETFDGYRGDISEKMESKEIDLLLVKTIFTTGFDCPRLNTLYVDKKMEYHTLLQTFSRTNRLCGKSKPHGNIVCFRNLKKDTDEALTLFNENHDLDTIKVERYEDKIKDFKNIIFKFKQEYPSVEVANNLEGESSKLKFLKLFGEVIKEHNNIKTYNEFSFDEVDMSEEEFEKLSGIYATYYDDIKKEPKNKDKIEDIEFVIELIHSDLVNVDYIINLMNNISEKADDSYRQKQKIAELKDIIKEHGEFSNDQKELLLEFIDNVLLTIDLNIITVEEKLDEFIEHKRNMAINKLIDEEKLDKKILNKVIDEYVYSGLVNDELLEESVLEEVDFLSMFGENGKVERVKNEIINIINIYNL